MQLLKVRLPQDSAASPGLPKGAFLELPWRRVDWVVGGCVCFAAVLMATSCSSPIAVAEFANGARKAIEQGPVVFADLPESCARRVADQGHELGAFDTSAVGAIPPHCTVFVAQREALVKASGVLEDYFEALDEVASFGTCSLGVTASANAQELASQANLKDHGALSALAGILVQAATEGYQRKRLAEHIRAANTPIQNVTMAFAEIAVEDYQNGLLLNEEQTLVQRYNDFAERKADRSDPVVFLLLARRQEDMSGLVRRRAAVAAYVGALEQIRKGHQELANAAGRLESREVVKALGTYTKALENLTLSVHFLR